MKIAFPQHPSRARTVSLIQNPVLCLVISDIFDENAWNLVNEVNQILFARLSRLVELHLLPCTPYKSLQNMWSKDGTFSLVIRGNCLHVGCNQIKNMQSFDKFAKTLTLTARYETNLQSLFKD